MYILTRMLIGSKDLALAFIPTCNAVEGGVFSPGLIKGIRGA
jgi:hypothetical protein